MINKELAGMQTKRSVLFSVLWVKKAFNKSLRTHLAHLSENVQRPAFEVYESKKRMELFGSIEQKTKSSLLSALDEQIYSSMVVPHTTMTFTGTPGKV